MPGRPRTDKVGQKCGRWTIINFHHSMGSGRGSFYLCQCECGTKRVIEWRALRDGRSKSCGCLQKDMRDEPHLVTARYIWNINYNDGCSFGKFLELSQLPCYYCGRPPSNKYNVYVTKANTKKANALTVPDVRANEAWFIYNGLDRLNSDKTHTEDNVVPCCYVCNTAKMDMSVEEFKNWIITAYNYFASK